MPEKAQKPSPKSVRRHSKEIELAAQHKIQAVQKGLRCEAREKSTSGGVLWQYVWSEAIERDHCNARLRQAMAGEPFSTAC
jgi:hypothetical protein